MAARRECRKSVNTRRASVSKRSWSMNRSSPSRDDRVCSQVQTDGTMHLGTMVRGTQPDVLLFGQVESPYKVRVPPCVEGLTLVRSEVNGMSGCAYGTRREDLVWAIRLAPC